MPAVPAHATTARSSASPSLPAPTVTFGAVRAANTPAKTPDRIPPKVDTPVSVSFGGTTGVTISVKPIGKASADPAFGPGEALVNGKPSIELAAPGTIQVRGTMQSFHISVGLRLVAEQGGKEVGASAPFAVSALPVGMDMKKRLDKGHGEPARGMVVAYNVRSDSGDQTDLDRLKVKEVLQSVEQEGCFKAISPTTLQDQAPGYGLGVNEERTDTHTVRADILSGPGLWKISQIHKWNDTRTGAEGVMPHSAYVIQWSIGPFSGGAPGLYFILTKFGMDTTAQGESSDFGFGMAFTVQEK